MVNLGGKITTLNQTLSIGELNQKMLTRMTGTEISEHDFQNEPLNVLCIADGAGYITGHIYCADDNGVLRDIFQPHTHLTSANGGSLYDIYKVNYNELIQMDYSTNISKNFFKTSGSASSTFDDFLDTTQKYIIATTNTATDAYMNAVAGGGRLFFGKSFTLQLEYAVSINDNIAYRMGCGMTPIENAAGSGAQIGFEGCTSGPSPSSNGIASADGTTRTVEYLSAMVQSFPMGLRADYNPGAKIVAMDGLGTVVNKTTNLPPISSATLRANTFRASVKTTNSTAKWLKLYAARLVGASYDSQSGIGGWI